LNYIKIHFLLFILGANSDKIDIGALIYSMKRLPENIFENYVYVLVNKFPRIVKFY
jgi:hypothetical protein